MLSLWNLLKTNRFFGYDSAGTRRSQKSARRRGRPEAKHREPRRRLLLEALDRREVLSVTLPVLSDQTLSAGAPLQVALQGSDSLGNALSYSVSVTNSNLSDGSGMTPQITAIVPTGNPTLKLSVSYTDPSDATNSFAGDLVFQLEHDLAPNTVDQITKLVTDTSIRNQPYFDGLTFHRIIEGFMAQGGDPNGDGTGGPGYSYDDEFNQSLRFTSSGVLALANSGSDTNGSQFFITDGAQRFLDFRYTIFGFLVSGQDTFAKLMSVPVHTGTSGENSSPDNTVTITSATLVDDTQDGLVRLSVSKGTTGTATVTVTATDAVTGEHAAQSFQVTVAADTTVEPPFFSSFNPIQTGPNSPITVSIPGVNVSGGTVTYSGSLLTGSDQLTLSVNSSTGQTTLTPNNATPGVYSASFSVKSASSTADKQIVPIYINPASPTSIQLLTDGTASTATTTTLDNTAGKTLQFQVSGITAGNHVELFADGVSLGEATATDTSVTITTNGTVPLTAGSHQITARQTLPNQTVIVGNLRTTANLASSATSPLTLTVADSSSNSSGSGDASGSGDTSSSTGSSSTETGTGTASLSGYVFVDMNGDGKRVSSAGQSQLVMSGVTVRLYRKDDQGNWNEVTGSPVQTDSNGAYHFSQLDAATYRIGVTPPSEYLDGASLVGTVGGTARGTAGTDQIDAITLNAGEAGSEYDFSLAGLQRSHISRRLFLASTPAWETLHVMLHTAPTVTLSGVSSGSGTTSSALTNSTTTTGSATFSAGNSAVTVASGAAITSPGSPTLAGMTISLVNPPDGASEVLSVDTTGTTINASFSSQVLTLSGVADMSKYQSVLDTLKYQDSASAPQEGERLIEIVADDGTAHSAMLTITVVVSSTSSPTGTTPTQTAPSGYSITVDSATITSSNATATGFTLSGATVDATYNYTVTSSGGGTVTGSGTVTSTTQDVTGIDVSTLTDGTLTYSVTLTNSVGTGAAATATATLDRAAPSGYSITADTTSLNSTSAQSAGFTFAGATVGTTYNYSVTSSAGGTAVTGSGAVTSATQDVTGINVSSLPNGTLTFSVTLTNAQGTGSPATATATLTQTAPADYTISVTNSSLTTANDSNTGFTIFDGEVGATYHYTVTSSGGGTPLTGTGTITSATQDITGIDLTPLSAGTLTFSVSLTNASGTGSLVTATASLLLAPPANYLISLDNSSLNPTTAQSAGFMIFGGEVGATYQYTVTSDAGGTPVTGSGVLATETQDITGIDVSSLPAGVLTFSVTLSNAAGSGPPTTAQANLSSS